MKAIVRDAYGGPEVLKFEDVPEPHVGRDDVLVRVRASSIGRADKYILHGRPFPLRFATGLFAPKKRGVGLDFSGDVVAIGEGVVDVRVGDAVFGETVLGEAWAEYVCVPAKAVAAKPTTYDHEHAAVVPGSALTALQGLVREAGLVSGMRVLINGATGGVGPYAVQIAKAYGAQVTGVCSARHEESVAGWGADVVLAYEYHDVTRGDVRFDVVFDVVGNRSVAAWSPVIASGGVYVAVGAPEDGMFGPGGHMIATFLTAPFVRPRVAQFVESPKRTDLETLRALLDAGRIRPAVSRAFSLHDVADAFRWIAQERPAAKVALVVP